jgi:hypothetical protein
MLSLRSTLLGARLTKVHAFKNITLNSYVSRFRSLVSHQLGL